MSGLSTGMLAFLAETCNLVVDLRIFSRLVQYQRLLLATGVILTILATIAANSLFILSILNASALLRYTPDLNAHGMMHQHRDVQMQQEGMMQLGVLRIVAAVIYGALLIGLVTSLIHTCCGLEWEQTPVESAEAEGALIERKISSDAPTIIMR